VTADQQRRLAIVLALAALVLQQPDTTIPADTGELLAQLCRSATHHQETA